MSSSGESELSWSRCVDSFITSIEESPLKSEDIIIATLNARLQNVIIIAIKIVVSPFKFGFKNGCLTLFSIDCSLFCQCLIFLAFSLYCVLYSGTALWEHDSANDEFFANFATLASFILSRRLDSGIQPYQVKIVQLAKQPVLYCTEHLPYNQCTASRWCMSMTISFHVISLGKPVNGDFILSCRKLIKYSIKLLKCTEKYSLIKTVSMVSQ